MYTILLSMKSISDKKFTQEKQTFVEWVEAFKEKKKQNKYLTAIQIYF